MADCHGILPSWKASPKNRVLAVGHDTKFSIIDVANTRIIAVRAVIAPFYEFIPGEWGDRFIVLYEIGALVFDRQQGRSNACASKRIRQYRPGDKHRCRHLCQAKIELPHHLL